MPCGPTLPAVLALVLDPLILCFPQCFDPFHLFSSIVAIVPSFFNGFSEIFIIFFISRRPSQFSSIVHRCASIFISKFHPFRYCSTFSALYLMLHHFHDISYFPLRVPLFLLLFAEWLVMQTILFTPWGGRFFSGRCSSF